MLQIINIWCSGICLSALTYSFKSNSFSKKICCTDIFLLTRNIVLMLNNYFFNEYFRLSSFVTITISTTHSIETLSDQTTPTGDILTIPFIQSHLYVAPQCYIHLRWRFSSNPQTSTAQALVLYPQKGQARHRVSRLLLCF